MPSQIGIWNKALRCIGESRLTATTDPVKSATLLGDAWEGAYRAEFEANPWNFAIKRTALAASTSVPEFEWEYAYPLPSECAFVIDCPELDRRLWTIENTDDQKTILTKWNNGQALNVRYTSVVTEVSKWPQLFADAVAFNLAMEICESITQSNSKMEIAASRYSDAIKMARRNNAIELPPVDRLEDDLVLVRS